MIPTLFLVSIVTFVIIQLPPGDYLDSLAADMGESGSDNTAIVETLRQQYGLGQPMYVQYYKWMKGILLHGNFGISFEKNVLVTDLIWDRLGWTFGISILTLLFIWITALPIGIYSAVRKYSFGDYTATFFGFIGLAVPNFLLALVMMYCLVQVFRPECRRPGQPGIHLANPGPVTSSSTCSSTSGCPSWSWAHPARPP